MIGNVGAALFKLGLSSTVRRLRTPLHTSKVEICSTLGSERVGVLGSEATSAEDANSYLFKTVHLVGRCFLEEVHGEVGFAYRQLVFH